MDRSATIEKRRGWSDAAAVYLDWRVLAIGLLGFAAGLPYLLVFSTLSTWLREAGINLATIGFVSWIGTFYSIKVLWAPVVDRAPISFLTSWLGRRRSWMLLAQLGIVGGLIGMAASQPSAGIGGIAIAALVVAFASATNDIALDAFRIEAAQAEMQGAMSGSYTFGYRVALLASGAGALYIAQFQSWTAAYLVMAAGMLVGIVTVLVVREPTALVDRATLMQEEHVVAYLDRHAGLPLALRAAVGWLYGAVACPIQDFFRRQGWMAIVILAFIGVYKLSDIVMGVMANPFYIDLGFTKAEIASVTKIYGFVMSSVGAFLGGVVVARWGPLRPLALGALLVALPNLMFMLLAVQGRDTTILTLAISADNLGGGLAATALIAYLSSLTNAAYTATQYALFSSLMTLPGRFLGGLSGVMVNDLGYVWFFLATTALGLPAILLALYLMRHDFAGAGSGVGSRPTPG